MIRLGVNIDHVATVRNARGESHPDPYLAAIKAIKYGADSITIHLREDRRHIKDSDLKKISKNKKIPLNLEMAANLSMLRVALNNKPSFVCIVPEKRKEITTEGGLNLKRNTKNLKKIIYKLKKNKIRVSLFIEPKISDVIRSKELNTDCIELHTGRFCNLFNNKKRVTKSFEDIKKPAALGKKMDLEIHAGHGLTYSSAKIIAKINDISEFNIGHFIISDSIFIGLKNSIRKFIKILNKKK